jgi:hypothetical protein
VTSAATYATVVFDAPQASLPGPDVTRVVDLAEAARAPGVQVDIGGPVTTSCAAISVSQIGLGNDGDRPFPGPYQAGSQ